jgi:hypothetical protein
VNQPEGIWIFMLLLVLSIPPLLWVLQFVDAKLYENGTCTNERLTNSSNQTKNTNGTVDDFLKSLPSDNTILAKIVCQDDTNEIIQDKSESSKILELLPFSGYSILDPYLPLIRAE